MRLAAFKAGSTFSYAGVVSGLDPLITWGARSTAKAAADLQCGGYVWPSLAVTFTAAVDYLTTGNYDIALFATAVETSEWGRTAEMAFDILFFNIASTDPVVITETIFVPILRPIT